MIEVNGRKDNTRGTTPRGRTNPPAQKAVSHTTSHRAEQEIEAICNIIKSGYLLGLGSHSKLSPRERFEFAVRLEEICTIAEWMSRYVEYQETLGQQ